MKKLILPAALLVVLIAAGIWGQSLPGTAQLALANASMTINGTTCSLGSSCTPAAGTTVSGTPPYVTIGSTPYLFLFPATQPPTSSWSWVNQGTSTATATNGALLLSIQAGLGLTRMRCYMRSLPASTGYTVEAGMMSLNDATGLAISDGTKFVVTWVVGGGTYWIENWNAYDSFSGRVATLTGWNNASPNFMRFRDASGTRYNEVSADGVNWTTLKTDTTATFLTETTAGVCYEIDKMQGAVVNLAHWKTSTP